MAKRKNLTKKVRFEVFKRDGFKCQYCGKSSPNVVLEVDHIKPIAEGGTNDMINLVTSCFDCNRGKGKTKLDDMTKAKLEKFEIQKLKAQREQMEQYIEWRKQLLDNSNDEFEKLNDLLDETGYHFNEHGKKSIIKFLKKYGFIECYESLEICLDKYDVEKVNIVEKLGNILANRKLVKENPQLKDIYYVRAIIRNRFNYINEWMAKELIQDAFDNGHCFEELKEIAKNGNNWTDWRRTMEDLPGRLR